MSTKYDRYSYAASAALAAYLLSGVALKWRRLSSWERGVKGDTELAATRYPKLKQRTLCLEAAARLLLSAATVRITLIVADN